jgi:hypothetical protein
LIGPGDGVLFRRFFLFSRQGAKAQSPQLYEPCCSQPRLPDRALAEVVYAALAGAGLSVWLDNVRLRERDGAQIGITASPHPGFLPSPHFADRVCGLPATRSSGGAAEA